jgi:nucleoside-diphosphate-sugar epimerase
MNILSEKQMRLVIVGATGMVGGYAVGYALDYKSVGRVTAIGRRELGIAHPKLKQILHRDFANCSALADELSGQNAAVFCLGAYTGVVPDEELRRITVDYTVEFARVLRAASPAAAFSFLSGSGRPNRVDGRGHGIPKRDAPSPRQLGNCYLQRRQTQLHRGRSRWRPRGWSSSTK